MIKIEFTFDGDYQAYLTTVILAKGASEAGIEGVRMAAPLIEVIEAARQAFEAARQATVTA